MENQMITQKVDVSQNRAALYEALLIKANRAQTCKVKHWCLRHHHTMSPMHGGHGDECEVYDRFPSLLDGEDGSDRSPELVFNGTQQGCNEYIRLATQGQGMHASRYYTNHPGQCTVCDAFDARRAATLAGRQPSFLVVAWGVSRHFGGREEGGWYYDRITILEVRKAHTLQQGLRHARELKAENPQPRFNRFSCANRGEPEVVIRCFYSENDPRFPQETTHIPSYE